MVGEMYVWTSRRIQKSWILSCTVTETIYSSKILNLIWNCQNTGHFWQNESISWATLTYSTSAAFYWMKQLFIIETNSVKNGYSLSNEQFVIVPGIEIVILKQ